MKSGWSIRAQLFLLIAVLALPLTALIARNLYYEFATSRATTSDITLRLAETTAAETSRFLRDAHTVLIGLSQRPLVRALDPQRCDPLFKGFADLSPHFANVLTIDLAGDPVCSVVPLPARPTATKTALYDLEELVRTGKFTIGKPTIGYATGKWIAVLAHPLRDQQGKLSGAVALPIDLANFHPRASDTGLPPGTNIRIVTDEGTIVASMRDTKAWVGKDARDIPSVGIILARKRGVASVAGVDGDARIYGFTPIAGTNWYAYAGIPAGVAFENSNEQVLQSAMIAAAIVLLAIAFAVFAARSVARPVQAIAKIEQDIARGERAARFPVEGPAEIAAVVMRFNCVLDTLAQDERLLRDGKNQLDGILNTVMEGIVSIDEQQHIMIFNPGAERMFGRTAAQMIGQPLGALVPERFRARHDEQIRRFAATGETNRAMGRYSTIFGLRASGEEFPAEATISKSGISPDVLLTVTLRDVSERVQAERALRNYAEQLRQLSRRMFEVEESERRRLARELHDRIGQNVTALSLNLNLVRSELPADTLQKMSPRLNDCESLLYYTAQLVRDIQVDLRPPGLDELGLVAALNEHARQVVGRSSFKVTVVGTEIAPRLPPATEITLFRIVQEALNNISKHAQATEVTITVKASPDEVIVTIADNGRGFDPAARPAQPTRSLGMVSMRERAESMGGTLRIESAPSQGSRVNVAAPRATPNSSDQPRLPGIEPA